VQLPTLAYNTTVHHDGKLVSIHWIASGQCLSLRKKIFLCVCGGGGGIDYGVKDQTVLQVRNGSGKQTFGTSLFSMIHRLSVIVELKM
jgi:hypothetical protein